MHDRWITNQVNNPFLRLSRIIMGVSSVFQHYSHAKIVDVSICVSRWEHLNLWVPSTLRLVPPLYARRYAEIMEIELRARLAELKAQQRKALLLYQWNGLFDLLMILLSLWWREDQDPVYLALPTRWTGMLVAYMATLKRKGYKIPAHIHFLDTQIDPLQNELQAFKDGGWFVTLIDEPTQQTGQEVTTMKVRSGAIPVKVPDVMDRLVDYHVPFCTIALAQDNTPQALYISEMTRLSPIEWRSSKKETLQARLLVQDQQFIENHPSAWLGWSCPMRYTRHQAATNIALKYKNKELAMMLNLETGDVQVKSLRV